MTEVWTKRMMPEFAEGMHDARVLEDDVSRRVAFGIELLPGQRAGGGHVAAQQSRWR
jgi:hypothetical protein